MIVVGFLSWFVFFKNDSKDFAIPATSQTLDSCGQECKKEIDKAVSASLSTVSGETKEIIKETVKTVTITPAPVVAKDQVVYLPIAGPLSSTSTSWYDLGGTEFYLDYGRDYGEEAYANWDASLSVANGNGTTYARLYDVTNKIAVNGSEVSVSSSSDLSQVSSGKLYFWQGRNLYRVQIKSLNGYEATFGGGRIKIVY